MTKKTNVTDISRRLKEAHKNRERAPAKGVLVKNSGRSVAKVRQYDFLINAQESRGIEPDEDGDCMLYVNNEELMIGADVRVLVKTDAAPDDVVRALLKTTQWIMSINKLEKEIKEFDLPF